MSPSGTKSVWIGRGLSLLPCLVCVFSAVTKLRGGPDLARRMAHLGLPESLLAPLAILELSCVAIYLLPKTSVLGAVLLTGYLGGAICAHVRVGDPWFFEAFLGILVWLGLYLREPRLRALLPLRTS
jgi:DoxX-like protein